VGSEKKKQAGREVRPTSEYEGVMGGGRPVPERTLAAARALFAEKGYAGASTRDLAQAVGVTVPGLYYHFGSKKGILVALVEQDLQARIAAVERGLAESGGAEEASARGASPPPSRPEGDQAEARRPEGGRPHRRRLEAALAGLMESQARAGGMPGVVMHDPNLRSDPELRGLVQRSEERLLELLAGVLRQGVEADEFRLVDARETAVLLLAAARAVHLIGCFRPNEAGQERLAAGMLHLLLHGLVATETDPAEG
jgi:AcrR family transcriptional regulator